MTIGKALIAACVAAIPFGALAQTRISPDAFLDAVIGKTVEFYNFPRGDLVGTEEFLNRSWSVWRMEGRGCVYGQITTPNGQICFLYDGDEDGVPVCWWPYLHEDRLMVRLATFERSVIQEAQSITEDGLNCPSAPTS